MIWKLIGHVRRNLIACIALVVAMSGTAFASSVPFLKVGDAAGGALTGTYPNPTIAANAIGSAEVLDGSLRSDDIGLLKGTFNADLGPISPGGCPGVGQIRAGLQTSDFVIVLPTDPLPFRFPAQLVVHGRIEAEDESVAVVAYVCNISSFDIDPPDTTFRYIVIR
jgi:hypothetical protein